MQPTLSAPRGIRLRDVLPQARHAAADVHVQRCARDPQQVRPGDLFVAIVDQADDGHAHIAAAIARGAAAVVAEQMVPAAVPITLVDDSRQAWGRLCQALAGDPAQHMHTFGITGTNGKTTTAHLLNAVLDQGGFQSGVCSSLTRSGSSHAPQQSTPPAEELAAWLQQMHTGGRQYAVLEASSRALAEYRLAGLQFDAAVITNIRRDHLDLHGNVHNYRQAKRRLLEQLKPHGFAVLNADDAACRQMMGHLDCPVITTGRHTEAEVTATIVERHASEQTFLLHAGNETVPVQTHMIGDHHVSNCLAAAAVGLVLGIPLTTIARGLESVRRLPGRLDRIECGQPFRVFVDAAETPDRLAVCLRALRQITRGRVLCVYSSAANGRVDERPLLGRIAERAADLGIITGHGMRASDSYELVHDILDGYERPGRAHVIPNRAQAIEFALQTARPGDSVLIAGSAPALLRRQGKATGPDQEVARRWLYESAAAEPTVIPFPAL